MKRSFITIKKRSSFLKIQKGVYAARPVLTVQALLVPIYDHDSNFINLGFTVTKKMGNAVIRNRIKRRFREAAHHGGMKNARFDTHYVVIARHGALTEPFESLITHMDGAVKTANKRLLDFFTKA